MNESMYKYMDIGLILPMAYPNQKVRVEEAVKKIATDSYFTAVEITQIPDERERENVKKILDCSHMRVTYGAHSIVLDNGLNPNSIDERERRECVAILKNALDEADQMGAEAFTFLSGRYEERQKEEGYRALIETSRELCEYANKLGSIKVLLEVFDYNVDKSVLIGPADRAARFAEEITSEVDNFGLTVDLSHIPLIGESNEEALNPVKDYLTHAHLGNCVKADPGLPRYGDKHPWLGFPGGENDVEEVASFLRTLLDIGFLSTENPPIVNFEVKPSSEEDPDVVVANSQRVLNQAWAIL